MGTEKGIIVGRRAVFGNRYGGALQKTQVPKEERRGQQDFEMGSPETHAFLGINPVQLPELPIEWRRGRENENMRVFLHEVQQVFLETRDALDAHAVQFYQEFVGALRNHFAESHSTQVVMTIVARGCLAKDREVRFIKVKAMGRFYVLPKSFLPALGEIRLR